ncbi:MAG: GNAT family N-acetyltransferase [Planctomycetes bacterium]|nr:GNAT family N-acetyltransferase [Planctomycetota bacterium]
MSAPLLEVCVDSRAGLAAAVAGGARRLEVCARLEAGGLTPEDGLLREAVASGLPCVAMVRPRGGTHVWSPGERVALLDDLARVKHSGAQAVVLGAITVHGRVDRELASQLVEAARPLVAVFHRAFDAVHDRDEALESLVELGFARVLTSGGAPDAFSGRFELGRLVQQAATRITILPGGGVRAHNAAAILAASGARELHSSTPFRLPEVEGPPGLRVRPEQPHDHAAVEALVAAAFGRAAEARLVARLRADPLAVSLVAEQDGTLVGHVLFTPIRAGGRSVGGRAMGLAPLSVAERARRSGIGARLVHEGLALLRRRGTSLVVVLGEPGYYGRFGFTPAAPAGLACRYGGEDGAFQLLELAERAAAEQRGTVEYDPAFDEVG